MSQGFIRNTAGPTGPTGPTGATSSVAGPTGATGSGSTGSTGPTGVASRVVTSYAPTAGGTATIDLTTGNQFIISMPSGTGATSGLAVSGGATGQVFSVDVVQGPSGSNLVTWFSTVKWAGGSAPTLTTTANKIDSCVFTSQTPTTFQGYIAGQNV